VAALLLVDDNRRMRDAVAWLLEREGHRVRVADNGRAALAVLASGKTDVVVTDIHMPDTDGLELIMECRRMWPDLPVIAMSGGGYLPTAEVLEDARLLGAVEALEKPFEFGVLRAALERVLADRTSSAPSE